MKHANIEPTAYMEFIYIDDKGNARHTNQRCAESTDAKTQKLFESYRRYEVPTCGAKFVLDLYNKSGDLIDTLCLDGAIYAALTGQQVQPDSHYIEIDEAYWAEAQAEYQTIIRRRRPPHPVTL